MKDIDIKIGTRGSKLALWQANHVIGLLQTNYPTVKFNLTVIKTTGDTDRTTALEKIGETGLFTKKIEQALLDKVIDIAIHSAKDLPSIMTDGLVIGAVPERAPCEDVWLSGSGAKVMDSKPGSVVGSGSPRRRAQLLSIRPDLKVVGIRGNIETRLKKMQDGRYDALIMARAGLVRAGYQEVITEVLPPDKFVPAPGQGSLLVQIRENDTRSREITTMIDNPRAHRILEIERLLLARLKAGCSTPVGGWAYYENEMIGLIAVVLDNEGTKRLYVTHKIKSEQANETLVDEVVRRLLSLGAGALICD